MTSSYHSHSSTRTLDMQKELESLTTLSKEVSENWMPHSDAEERQMKACLGLVDMTWEMVRKQLIPEQEVTAKQALEVRQDAEKYRQMFSEFEELIKVEDSHHTPGVVAAARHEHNVSKEDRVLAMTVKQHQLRVCALLSSMMHEKEGKRVAVPALCRLLSGEEISTTDIAAAAGQLAADKDVRSVRRRMGQQEIRAGMVLCNELDQMVSRQTRSQKAVKVARANRETEEFCSAYAKLERLATKRVLLQSLCGTKH